MMKSWIAIACFSVALVSCDKVEHNLEGKWQLKTVEANGSIQPVDTVWYNFQTSLFGYQLYNPTTGNYQQTYGFRTLEGDKTLRLELESGKNFLRYTDWKDTVRVFSIEESTVTKLVLNSEGKTYTFRKF